MQIVYTMPPAIPLIPKLAEIKSQIHEQGSSLILMIDHPEQIKALKDQPTEAPWLVYLKLDIGSKWVKEQYSLSAYPHWS